MKTTIKLTIALLLMLTVNNCKKIKERKKTTINLSVLNTITKEGSLYSGIPFKLIKETEKKFNYENTYNLKVEDVCEGVINSEGKATIEFFREMSHKKVKFTLFVNYETKGFYPDQVSQERYIYNVAQEKENNITILISEKVTFPIHIKNSNCYNSNDKIVLDFSNQSIFIKRFFSPLNDLNTYTGCTDTILIGNLDVEDYYPYTKTITRNGVTTTTYDTLVVSKAMEGDTINIFY